MNYNVFDSFFEGIQVISPDYEYLYVNPEVAQQAHSSVEELTGKKMLDLFPQLADTDLFAQLKKCMDSGESLELVNHFTDNHNNSSYYRVCLQRVEDGVMITSQDITSLKKKEFELIESNRKLEEELKAESKLLRAKTESLQKSLEANKLLQARFETIINHTQDAIALLTFNEEVIYVNENMSSLLQSVFGQRPREGETWDQYVLPDLKKVYNEGIVSVKQGEPYSAVERVKSEDVELWFVFRLVPIMNDGEVSSFILFATDITAERNSLFALEQSEDKFRRLVENSLIGVYVIQNGAVVYINPTFANIFGYEYSDIEDGVAIDQIVHPEDVSIVQSNIQRRLLGEVDSLRYEARGLSKDGQVFWFEVVGNVSVYNGEKAIIGTLQDITKRKKEEEQAMRDLKALEELSYITSHELRHEYSNLYGLVQLLHSVEQVDAELRKNLEEGLSIFKKMDKSIEKLDGYVKNSRKNLT